MGGGQEHQGQQYAEEFVQSRCDNAAALLNLMQPAYHAVNAHVIAIMRFDVPAAFGEETALLLPGDVR
jgi:hypothetical protein